jgi:hypothetical protein
MLTSGRHDSLCPHHLNRLKVERAKNDEAVAAELLGNVEDFSSAYEVHQFLGALLKQLVHKRVRRRDAMAQAYLCQLLLNTFPYLRQETADEICRKKQEFVENYLAGHRALPAEQDSADTPTTNANGG